jgi:hypothetical protein
MRSRVAVPVIGVAVLSLVLSACGSAGDNAGQSLARDQTPSTQPTAEDLNTVLILASRQGTVSVRPATGAVPFRAPYGVAAPDSSTVVQAQPITTGTRVVSSDPRTGVPRWSHDVKGTRKVRVVAPGGRFVALVDGSLTFPSSARTSTTIDIATAAGTRALRLAGNLDPEAFSTNGRYLYVLDFLPAMNPTRYSVRRVDLQTLRIEGVPDREGGVREPMPGYARTQLMSPDGKQLYTFYASPEPVHDGDETYHAWVHVLNLAEGWAHCVDLDEKIGEGGNANAGLAVSPDGSRLFVTDGVAHAVAAIDTSTLEVVRTRFLPTLQNADATAITATDGHTVFVRNRLGGISAVDAQTLALQPEAISDSEGITGLRMNAAGTTLYLLSQSGFVVADRRGRIEHRWPNPGDATSIDPSVTVPGAGAYQCAC